MPSMSRPTPSLVLPGEVLANIFSFMGGRRVARAACVCQGWNKTVNAKDEMWLKLFVDEFGYRPSKIESMTWKQTFVCEWKWRYGKLDAETIKGYAVECIQLTPKGLIAGSLGGPVIIDPSDGSCKKLAKALEGDMFVVTCFKSVGQWIVGASSLSTDIRIWDIEAGTCCSTLKGGPSNILCLEFIGCPPKTIVTGNNDGTIGVWDVESKRCIKIMRGHRYMVSCITFSRDFVLSGSCDRSIKVWPMKYGQCMETWEGHTGAVTCLEMNGDLVVTGSYDSTVRVWDLTSSECVKTFDHPDEVLCLKSRGQWIVTACGDKYIRLYNIASGKCFRKILGPSAALSLDFDGYCIVGGFENNTVCMWSIDALASNFAPRNEPVVLTPDGFLERVRSLPSGIPRFSSLTRPISLLHSAATDLPDEESDVFKDTVSEASDEFYEGFELDVAIAVGNVFKDPPSIDSDRAPGGDVKSQLRIREPEIITDPQNDVVTSVAEPKPTKGFEHKPKDAGKGPTQSIEVNAAAVATPKEVDAAPNFVSTKPKEEEIQVGEDVIGPHKRPIGVAVEKVGESTLDQPADAPKVEQEKRRAGRKCKSLPKKFSIMRIIMRTMPCLLLGACFLFVGNRNK